MPIKTLTRNDCPLNFKFFPITNAKVADGKFSAGSLSGNKYVVKPETIIEERG